MKKYLILLFILIPSLVFAANPYWVDPNGEETTWANCQSASELSGSSACTIDTAFSNASGDNLVYFQGGTYYPGHALYQSNSGTDDSNRVVYQNYNSETVTLNFGGSYIGVLFYGKSHITFDGIDITNLSGCRSIWTNNKKSTGVSTSNVTIQNCDLDGGIYGDAITNFQVLNNTITVPDVGSQDPAVSINGAGITQTRIEGNTISGNFDGTDAITHHYNEGVSEHCGDYHIVKDNTVVMDEGENCYDINSGNYLVYEGNSCEGTSTGFPAFGMGNSDGMSYIRISNNIIKGVPAWVEGIRPVPNDGTTFIQIIGNKLYGTAEDFISIPSATSTATTKVRIAHNTCDGSDIADTNLIEMLDGAYEVTNLQFKNNIIYWDDASKYAMNWVDPCDADMVSDGNLYWNTADSPGSDRIWNEGSSLDTLSEIQSNCGTNEDNGLESDPLFSDVGNNDYTLGASSPARDAGVFLTTITSATGSGTTFTVADSLWFYDGWGITGETGDTIKTQNGQTGTISSINYGTNQITLTSSISWVKDEGIGFDYAGNKPDIGAEEFEEPPPGPGIENPNPADEETGIGITTDLTWTNGATVDDVDVYFDDSDCTTQVVDGQDVETYDTGTMGYSTTYYWKVVVNPDDDNISFPSSGCYEFTTIATPPTLSGAVYNSVGTPQVYNANGPSYIYVAP